MNVVNVGERCKLQCSPLKLLKAKARVNVVNVVQRFFASRRMPNVFSPATSDQRPVTRFRNSTVETRNCIESNPNNGWGYPRGSWGSAWDIPEKSGDQIGD